MSAASFIGLAALQFQATALLGGVSIPWPAAFKTVISYCKLAVLDPDRLLASSGLPPATFQTLYICFVNLLPLLIVFVGLIAFQPVYMVGWYLSMAAATVLLGVGVAMHIGELPSFAPGAAGYMASGGALTFVLIVIGATAYCIAHVNDSDTVDVAKDQRAARAGKLVWSTRRVVVAFVIGAGAFLGACALTGFLLPAISIHASGPVPLVFGIVLFAVAAIAFIFFVANLSQRGRQLLVAAETFTAANALLGLLLLIDITYVPTIDYCVNSLLCATYSCPSGTVFNPRGNRDADSFATSAALFCDPCEFRDARCSPATGWLYSAAPPAFDNTSAVHRALLAPTAVEAVASYCPTFEGRQLWKYPLVKCSDPSLRYFTFSTGIVLAAYIAVVPFFYVMVIRMVTNVIRRDAKILPEYDGENIDALAPIVVYDRQVRTVEPAASSLYQPYRIFYRFFNISLLGYRLALVGLGSVAAPFAPEGGVFGLLALHSVGFVAVAWLKPFAETLDHAFALALAGCSIVNCVFAIAVMYAVEVPDWSAYVLFVTNVVVPLAVAVLTFKFVRDKNEKRAAAHKALHDERLASQLQSPMASFRGANRQDRAAGLAFVNGDGDEEEEELLNVPMIRSVSSMHRVAFERRVRKRGLSNAEPPPGRVFTEDEKAQVHDFNALLKDGLNASTADFVTKFFGALGFFFLIATGASAIGYMKGLEGSSQFVDGSTVGERRMMPVIAGYGAFDDMLNNCCCLQSRNPAAQYNVTERWICPGVGMPVNPATALVPDTAARVVVDRGRSFKSLPDDGLPLRSLCAATPSFGCSIVVSNVTGAVSLWCPNGTDAQRRAAKVTDFAQAYLF